MWGRVFGKNMYQVELSRFRVKKGKSAIVDEWMAFLNDHMKDTLLTLQAEKMYIETIFREILDGDEYLYWYSVQGTGGQAVEESSSYIDKNTSPIGRNALTQIMAVWIFRHSLS